MLSEKECRAICERLLGHVKADDASVGVSNEDYAHLRFAANAFTTSGRRENVNVGATVWIGKRRASASTNEIDDASLRAVVAQAEELARMSPDDREYLPTLGPQQYKPVSAYAEATANIAVAARARSIADAIAACEREQVVGAGFHQSLGTSGASATKNGNFSYGCSSLVSCGMTARTQMGDRSGYFLRNHFDVAGLDTQRVAHEAIGKALRSRDPHTMDAATYRVILEPQAVADLLGPFGFAFDARSADEGRSPFAAAGGKTRLGEKMFDDRLNFYSDPWHPQLPGTAAAQDGIPAEKLHLVRNGVLENLTYSRFWAQQKGKAPTPGPVNVIMESSAPPVSVEDMIKSSDKGLLVTRFWYIRPVNPRTALVTGLTRDGLWYVEKGAIQYPVRSFRFNQSLLELLAQGNVEAIGAPERVGSSEAQGSASSLLPALKVKEFHFTAQSEAV